MHLFLAINPPEKIKEEIFDQLRLFRKEYPYFNWVNFENYHITLHFFGDIVYRKDIVERLKNILFDQSSFYLYSFGADIFMKHKLLLYLNFRREKQLEDLVQKIHKDIGANDSIKFIPHLTFAKYRIPSKQQYLLIKKKIEKLNIEINFKVNKLYLLQTKLERARLSYTQLAQISLT